VHPVTTAGKLLGTLLQTYGPSLAAQVIDGPSAPGDVNQQILATAKAIPAKLGEPKTSS
jgi:hypothetical protein